MVILGLCVESPYPMTAKYNFVKSTEIHSRRAVGGSSHGLTGEYDTEQNRRTCCIQCESLAVLKIYQFLMRINFILILKFKIKINQLSCFR